MDRSVHSPKGADTYQEGGRPRQSPGGGGLTEGASQLIELATRLCSGLQAAGFELETRPFRPHLTVARVKRGNERDAERALRAVGPGEVARFHVGRLLLMKSELSPKGARHEEVRAFPLAGG